MRLFEIYPVDNLYGIWLCDHYEWKCCVIDDKIPVDGKDQPLNTTFVGNYILKQRVKKINHGFIC